MKRAIKTHKEQLCKGSMEFVSQVGNMGYFQCPVCKKILPYHVHSLHHVRSNKP